MRRIRTIEALRDVVGLPMPGDATSGVREMHRAGADRIAGELLKIIKIYENKVTP